MLLDAGGEDGTGSGTTPLSKGPEQQPAANFSRRVLNQGETQTLCLGPEVRDIAEIFGVCGDLLE